MSILIKDIEIPSTCLGCMNTHLRTAVECVEWTEINIEKREKMRSPTCPLSEIHEQINIPEATWENTDLHEPLLTNGFIQGWNECRDYVYKQLNKENINEGEEK